MGATVWEELERAKKLIKEGIYAINNHKAPKVEEQWLYFDGTKLTWYSGKYGFMGSRKYQYAATSGLIDGPKNYQKAGFQKLKERGPIPEGKYWVNLTPDPGRVAKVVDWELVPNAKGGIERIPTNSMGWTYGIEWGYKRGRLVPDKSTNTFGRTPNFYLHDSHKGYTHGCIEVETGFFNELLDYRKMALHKFTKLAVKVKYKSPKASTHGATLYTIEMHGIVRNRNTDAGEAGVTVRFTPVGGGGKTRETTTDIKGHFLMPVFEELEYTLEFSKPGFSYYRTSRKFHNEYQVGSFDLYHISPW